MQVILYKIFFKILLFFDVASAHQKHKFGSLWRKVSLIICALISKNVFLISSSHADAITPGIAPLHTKRLLSRVLISLF